MSEMRTEPFVIIGAGLSGLSAAIALRTPSVVLEKNSEPGGLVVGRKIGGYWFDLVPHMLYFSDEATERFVRPIAGPDLKPAVPDGWVETLRGITRYPIQTNLHGLDRDSAIACIRDFAKVTFGASGDPPRNMAEALRAAFGDTLCDVFLYPYNRKVWARDLSQMPSTLMWSVMRPSFEAVLRGAMADEIYPTYNANGWYPRPGPGAPKMTMALLSDALADRVDEVLLERSVVAVDLDKRLVEVQAAGVRELYHYERGLIVTMPMTQFADVCKPLPDAIRQEVRTLESMAVWMVCLCLSGKRPGGRGKWRYYADESLCFTRLIHMHEYDPDTCPPGGWSIMAEILEPSDAVPRDTSNLIATVERDARRAGAIAEGCEVTARHAWRCDPAYAVESKRVERIKTEFMGYLEPFGVHLVGRYGRWEYSSMGQALRQGMKIGNALSAANR